MQPIDMEMLAVTNKHLYFQGGVTSFRIPFKKIVSFTPYSDGVGTQKDGAFSKPQIFVTQDGWFTLNLFRNLADLPEEIQKACTKARKAASSSTSV
jgi:hypothetical protein